MEGVKGDSEAGHQEPAGPDRGGAHGRLPHHQGTEGATSRQEED